MVTKSKVSHLAALTPVQVRWARKVYDGDGSRHPAGRLKWSQTRIAKELGVSPATIANLLHGKTYKRV
jgi:hypothetical protein